ncbi:MAG: protein translocase subunit SecF [Caldilineaceae bacterium]|nr:protein translocase subunit SecF [Caldilineaceae bacterium]
MYKIVEKRRLWFLISTILTIPGILFMLYSAATTGSVLPLSIDFTGGTLWEMSFDGPVVPGELRQVFVDAGYSDTVAYNVEHDNVVQVKLKNIDTPQKEALISLIEADYGSFEELSYRSIGPSIGSEVSRAALLAIALASLFIILYVALAFRQVSHPFRYGTCAVSALIHDVFVVITFIGIMNLIAGWEINALFLTAVLTVIGYSVNDTIVVFDRIRENVRRHRSEPLATIANRSILETAQRSIATVVTTLLPLIAILILGGPTLRQFMATLIVGLISGGYSSIFNATALLVSWEERSLLPSPEQPGGMTDGTTALA